MPVKIQRVTPLRAIGAGAAALLVAGLAVAAFSALAREAPPEIKIEKPGQCVEPVAEMRRDHMSMLLRQRDQTVHRGIRTSRHSLQNCIDCHASAKTNSVLGANGFCQSCHAYAGVRMDCFECHSPSPRAAAANRPDSQRGAAAGGVGSRAP